MDVIAYWVNWMAQLMTTIGGERERQGMVGGLDSSSPWRDAVGVNVEARAQTLRTSVCVPDRQGLRGHSVLNDKATIARPHARGSGGLELGR